MRTEPTGQRAERHLGMLSMPHCALISGLGVNVGGAVARGRFAVQAQNAGKLGVAAGTNRTCRCGRWPFLGSDRKWPDHSQNDAIDAKASSLGS